MGSLPAAADVAGSGAAAPTVTIPNQPNIPADQPAAAPAQPSPAGPSYTPPAVLPVGPYDTLHLEMEGQPDLSRDYVVDANGDIQMLYLGKIRVGGLTVDQAQNVIAARLRKIYHDVSLTLTRTALGGISVTVTGAVARTGPVSVRRDARLNDVVEQLTPLPDADLNHVQINRSPAGQQSATIVADLGSYLETGNPLGNPPVKDGDVVFVPLKARAPSRQIAVSVVGAVPRPGRFDVAPGTTAYDAITMAGGPATDADLKNIYIEPAGEGQHTLIDWNLLSVSPGSPDVNPVLNDGDKIVVPEQTTASTFSIMGAVRNPNIYPLHGATSLLDALAMAGGYDTNAVPRDTKVVRTSPTGSTTININADDPVKAADFKIQPDDHIIVAQSKPKSGGLHLDPIAVAGLALTLVAIIYH